MGLRDLTLVGVAWLALGMSLPAPAAPVSIRDDAGRDVYLPAPATRVVSLAPNLTEFVFAIDAGDRVVGTIRGSDYPPRAAHLPKVGDHQRLDVEAVMQLRPDLVLAWRTGNPPRELALLAQAGVVIAYLEPRRLADIGDAWRRVGVLLGRAAQADTAAQAFEARIAELRERHKGRPPVRVFHQVWSAPLMTLNGEHLVSDMLQLCGGTNVFAELVPLVPRVGVEDVLARRPDVLLTTRESEGGEGDLGMRRDTAHPSLRPWLNHEQLPAVGHGNLYTVPGDLLSRPGPRLVDGVVAVCAALDDARARRQP